MEKQHPFSLIVEFREALEKHTAELAHDFRHFYGISIFSVGDEVSFMEGLLLIQELGKKYDSSWAAAQREWKFPMKRGEIALQYLTEAYINAHLPKNAKRFKLAWPWADVEKTKIGKKSIPLGKARAFFASIGHKANKDT